MVNALVLAAAVFFINILLIYGLRTRSEMLLYKAKLHRAREELEEARTEARMFRTALNNGKPPKPAPPPEPEPSGPPPGQKEALAAAREMVRWSEELSDRA